MKGFPIKHFNIVLVALYFVLLAPVVTRGDWQPWIYPDAYEVNKGEKLSLIFGVTGYGKLDPANVKFVIRAEEGTKLEFASGPGARAEYGPSDAEDSEDKYGIIVSTLLRDAPTNTFQVKAFPNFSPLALDTDFNTPFQKVQVTPSTSGDKLIDFTLVYSEDGKTWRTERREFQYHVRSWEERYRNLLAIIAFCAAVFAIRGDKFWLEFWIFTKKALIQRFFVEFSGAVKIVGGYPAPNSPPARRGAQRAGWSSKAFSV